MMSGYGRRVLIVDDEEAVRRLLLEQLEPHRFVVVAVADGLRAWRELHRRHFDAVITDLHMPYLDGLDLLHQCHLVWPELPVILMSGSFATDIVELAMTQGAAACLPKPVEREKLIHVLNEVVPDRLTPHPDQTGITSHQLEMEPQ
ncbi:MAG: response regulator [Nitrospira sp.]